MGVDPSPDPAGFWEQNLTVVAESNPLMLTTGGNLLPYTHWQYRYIPGLRKRAPEPFLEIHPDTGRGIGCFRFRSGGSDDGNRNHKDQRPAL